MYLVTGSENLNGKHHGHMFVSGKTFTDKYIWKDILERMGFKVVKISDNDKVKSILIIHYNVGIGDMLFITPAIKGLKEKFPDVTIEVFGNYPAILTLAGNPYISKLEYKFPAKYILSVVDEYDEVFDTSDFMRYNIECELSNIYDVYCKYLEVTPSDMRPVLHVAQIEKDNMKEYLSLSGIDINHDKLVVLQTHSTSITRTWPIQNTGRLAKELSKQGYKVAIVGEPNRIFTEYFREDFDPKDGIINLMGALDLRALIALISLSDLVIGPDSSGYHIAEALNIKSIPLFSSFDPYLRAKYYKYCFPIYKPTECGPCLCHSIDCPSKLSKPRIGDVSYCMSSISVEDVLNRLEEVKQDKVINLKVPNKIVNNDCPICNLNQKKLFCRKGDVYYWKCKSCGLLFTDHKIKIDNNQIETCENINKWINPGEFTFIDADKILDNTSPWINSDFCGKYHYILTSKALKEICNKNNIKVISEVKDKEHFKVQLGV